MSSDQSKHPNVAQHAAATAIFNSLVGAIPVVGPAIQEGLVDYWGRVKQERINLFLEGLKGYFESLNNSEIDPEFLRSEDFAQFFELVIKKVSETKSEAKHEYFRNILKNNLRTRSISDFSETFLNIIGQLHVQQIEILANHIHVDEEYYEQDRQIYDIKRKVDDLREKLRQENELNEKGKANNSTAVQTELDKWFRLLNEKTLRHDSITQEFKKFNADFEYITKPTFNFYIHDLASKSLLVDRERRKIRPSNTLHQNCNHRIWQTASGVYQGQGRN
jgi:hypothetical protein